jgi:hypothetical protein
MTCGAAAAATGAATTAGAADMGAATTNGAPLDLTIRTLPSASVISNSETLDSETKSIRVLSLRKSIENLSDNYEQVGIYIKKPGFLTFLTSIDVN